MRKFRNHLTKTIMVGMILILSVSFVGCGGDTKSDTELGEKYGTIFQSFSANDIYGATQKENLILDNKYTLVYVWATTCNPCIEAMPKMQSLYRDYKAQGLNVVGIVVNMQDSSGNRIQNVASDATAITQEKGVTFVNIDIPEPVMAFLYDEIQYTPTAFFVDQTGKIASELYVGGYEYDDWSEIIENLLEQ